MVVMKKTTCYHQYSGRGAIEIIAAAIIIIRPFVAKTTYSPIFTFANYYCCFILFSLSLSKSLLLLDSYI